MVSSSNGEKKDDDAADADGATTATTATTIQLNKSPVTLVPGTKPLKNYRFYLDVKSHITSSKLESKIKELGGVLELFLVKEVTHVVTDKEVWENASKGGGSIPKTPQTPSSHQSCSYSDHGTPEHSNAPNRGGRPKTRADAMLERARKTTPVTVVAKDPLVQAKQWGVKVCSAEIVLQWLEKVSEALRKRISSSYHLQHNRRYKVVELKAPYVKYEAFDRKHRPVFKELRNWPTFNFAAHPGSKGLVHQIYSADEQNNMTRRPRLAPPQELLFTRGIGAAEAAAAIASKDEAAATAEEEEEEAASLATAATIASLHKRTHRNSVVTEQQHHLQLQHQHQQRQELQFPLQPQSPLSGFCEVCRIDYKDIEVHIFDSKHIAFVKDESNFVELDKLIKDSASLESFLKSNGIDEIESSPPSPNALPNTITITPQTTSELPPKMPRTRTSSLCDREKSNCPLAPIVNERLLRTTRRAALANNLIANTADEEPPVKPEGAKEVRELRSAHKNTTPKTTTAVSQNSETWDSGRPKRSCNLKQKRLHSSDDDDDDDDDDDKEEEEMDVRVRRPKVRQEDDDEVNRQRQSRIAFEPRTFYKVNQATTSGQSTSKVAFKEQQEEANAKNKSAIIVKFRRMRTSELKQLNNEAENFLFPKREDESDDDDDEGRHDDDDDIDAVCPDTTASTARGETSMAIISDVEEEEEQFHERRRRRREQIVMNMDEDEQEVTSSPDNSSSSPSTKKRKKRMTHAEAFIQDNKKLRHQGTFMPTAKAVTRGNGAKLAADGRRAAATITKEQEESKTRTTIAKKDNAAARRTRRRRSSSSCVGVGGGADDDGDSGRLNLKELQFAFERVPKSEPWYQTFSRQDQGEEYYTCFSDSGYWKPFLLPYEMGPIPPLDPKVCISSYRQLKKHILEEVASNSAGGCSTPDSCSNEEETTATTLAHSEDSNSLDDCCAAPTKRGRRRRGCGGVGGGVVSGRNPRKSPRQHASTLAILSSLMPHRKKRERERERSSRNLLQVIPESKPEEMEATVDGERKKVGGDNIDDILSGAMDALGHFDHIDIQSEEEVSLRFTSNAIDSLQDYENYKHLENNKSGHLRRCYSPGKKPGRKKKKNRTGWPNKNNRSKHRKEVVHEDDSAPTEEDEDEDEEDDKDEEEEVQQQPQPPVNNRKTLTDQSVHKKSSESSKKSESVVVALDEEERPLSDRAIDLDRWDNAEKVLTAKVSNHKEPQQATVVRMQKIVDLDGGGGRGVEDLKSTNNRRLRSSSSPHRTNIKRQRRMPASPRSPRVLRKPRGRWYRER
ncbi:PREDICTED: protein chiffon isoform X2 [Nicrophorus vespilloides]|uniref:Protein chiffon isoform X2 n=1 Tax=Nicrophorus vespilloides TaxID=110193 RepID=A0ABM1MAK9_NICVS|nr:PREDICTED: protein chiffon isoform X2 [Nicrophorus vespilloides]